MSASTRRALFACAPLFLGSAGYAQKTPDVRLDVGDAPGASDSFEPSITSLGSSVYAVWTDWRQNAFLRGDIYFNRSLDNGATWLPSDVRLDVDTPPGANCSRHPIVCASGTDVYVVWQELRNFGGRVHFNRSSDQGATWGAEVRLDRGNAPGAGCVMIEPRIAVSGSSLYVVWQDQRNGPFDVFFNRSLDGGDTWLANDVRLDRGSPPGAATSFGARLAASGASVYVVWQDFRNGGYDLYFNRSLDGGSTWLEQDVRLDAASAPGEFSSGEPRIAASGSAVYVAWLEDRIGGFNPRPDVYFNRSLDGGDTWLSNEIRLDPGKVTGHSESLDIAADGSSVYATWADGRNGDLDVFFNRSLDGGSTWLANQVRLDTGSAPGSSLSSAVDNATSGSTIHVAWHDTRNGISDVYFNRSLDGGTTWLASDVRMNVSTAPGVSEAEFPKLAAEESACHVIWMDRRIGPGSDIHYTLALGYQLYGQGKAGSGGIVPTLAGGGSASIGGTAEFLVGAGLGGAQAVLIASLDGPAAIITNLGTFLVQPPWLLEGVTLAGASGVPGAGTASVPVPIPPDPSLVGARANFQAGVLDPGVTPALSLTQGLELWIL